MNSLSNPTMLRVGAYCARVVALCPDGMILIIKKADGHMEFPGGGSNRADKGNPANTALRELFEETGIKVTEKNRLTEIVRKTKDENHSWLCYLLYLTEEEVTWYKPESEEGKALRIYPNDLLGLYSNYMTPTQREILLRLVHGEFKNTAD